MKYSLDKIKLQCKLGNKQLLTHNKCSNIYDDLFNSAIEKIPKRFEVVSKSRPIFVPYSYRYGITLRVVGENEGVLWLACLWNGESSYKPNAKLCLIEFNPNKKSKLIFEYLVYKYALKVEEIKSCDVAFDIQNVTINRLFVDTRCDVMTYGNVTNYTTYIAPKARNGRVKIYQKDIEREIVGEKLEKTLRIEVSCKGDYVDWDTIYNKDLTEIEKAVKNLNSVRWLIIDDNLNEAAVLLLVNADTQIRKNALNAMSINTRAKYKKILCEYSESLNLELFQFVNILEELLRPYKKIGGKKVC